jgi:hypothetical protein
VSLPGHSPSRIRPSLAVLATLGTVSFALTYPAYRCAKTDEDARHYLKSFQTPSHHDAVIESCMDYATKSAERNDVVFIGGSGCLAGIRIGQLEHATGLVAYNLGTVGYVELAGHIVTLEAYLEHHPPPKLVVLCISPREIGPRTASKEFGEFRRGVRDRFLWCYGKPGDFPRPPHREPTKYYVSQGLLMFWGYLRGGEQYYFNKPISETSTRTIFSFKQEINANRGSYVRVELPPLSANATRDRDAGSPVPEPGATSEDPFPVMPAYDEGVRALARLTASKGIRLMIRLAPTLPGALPEHYDHIASWFEQLETDCPGVVCDRPEVLIYDPDCFMDMNDHCNLRGAERFTALVSASVTRALNTSVDNDSPMPIPNPTTSAALPGAE